MAGLSKARIYYWRLGMSDGMNRKRDEWRDLLAKHGGIIDTDIFVENAQRKESAFHDDFEWNKERALREYYSKRAANLIRIYSVKFNTVTAEQRLYAVPMPGSNRKVFKSAKKILRTEEERQAVIVWLWSRLRMVTRDIEPFAKEVPEFKVIYEFLKEHVAMKKEVAETIGKK